MNEEFKALWESKNFVVFDTEATGVKRPAEIIDLGMYDAGGNTLCDMLLKPKVPITPFITNLTHITNDMCKDAPTWPDVKDVLLTAMRGKTVVTYNAKFDRHMMHCSDEMWGLPQTDYHADITWLCAMEAYAPHHGDWDDYYGSYRWVSLLDAMHEQRLPVIEAHRARADAYMTWALIAFMVKQ